MKLGFHELGRHLKQQLLPVYVVTGDEPLQSGEATDQIRAAARERGYSERKIIDAAGNFDWNELTAESNSLSLFAEQRILDLRIPSGKPGTEGSKALSLYCENLPADTLLLVTLPRIDQQQTRSKWFKALDSAGASVTIWPVDDQRLPPWIEQRMRQKGLTPEKGVIQLLSERIEGNLLAANQEIEKLLLLYGPGIITTEQLAACVSDSARFDVFTLIDAALLGKTNRCVRILHGLKNEGTPSAVVLWALSREIRMLAQMAYALKNGANLNALYGQFKIWDKRKPSVGQGLKRLPLSAWQQLLIDCEAADLAIKGQLKQDPWLLMEQIALTMSGLKMQRLSA